MKHRGGSANSHSSESHQTPACASQGCVLKRMAAYATSTPHQVQQQRLSAEVEVLERKLNEEVEQNCRLRSALTYLEAGLLLLDQEQAGMVRRELVSELALPASLSRRPTLSVWALPLPVDWDAAFEERVRAMSSLELVTLHRQWLQELAMLLPRAQLHGSASPDHARLLKLMDTYTYFNHNAMVLAPDAWEGKAAYNLETMQRGQVPPMADVLDRCHSCFTAGMARTSATIQRYFSAATQLKNESVALAARHQELLHLDATPDQSTATVTASCAAYRPHSLSASCPQPSATAPFARPRISSSSRTYTTDDARGCKSALQDTLIQLQNNLWRHRMALRQCLHAVWQGLREECLIEVANTYVTTYPRVLDLIHFVDAASNAK